MSSSAESGKGAKQRKSQQKLVGKAPLPLDWKSSTLSLKKTAAQLIAGSNKPSAHGSSETIIDVYFRNCPPEGEREVTIYQRYKRPHGTTASKHREYLYTDENCIGSVTLVRPPPPPLFEYDSKLLATDPASAFGVKGNLQLKIEAAFPGPLAILVWQRELDKRQLKVCIYRMTHNYFDKMSLTDALDDFKMKIADDICRSMFGDGLTPEEVRSGGNSSGGNSAYTTYFV
jgi:hypothetical protein